MPAAGIHSQLLFCHPKLHVLNVQVCFTTQKHDDRTVTSGESFMFCISLNIFLIINACDFSLFSLTHNDTYKKLIYI